MGSNLERFALRLWILAGGVCALAACSQRSPSAASATIPSELRFINNSCSQECSDRELIRPAAWQECGLMSFKTLRNDTSLEGKSLRGLIGNEVILVRSELRRADFEGADLRGATVLSTLLTGARFRNAKLAGLKSYDSAWNGTDLRSADLRSARLIRVNFRNADLRDANLTNAILSGDFSGAKISDRTLLPFDRETAQEIGMIHVENNE